MRAIAIAALLCVLLAGAMAAPAGAEIHQLPGLQRQPAFRQYSGYLRANPNETAARELFYWFVESQSSPSSDPLFVWFQGGPGCSSLFGFLGENGPFRVAEDGATLHDNPFSWNKRANVLYIEAPAGVGFSTIANPQHFVWGDNQTRFDNYEALKDFFRMFPEFSHNDLYLTGESYGGHYVPQLAWTIVQAAGTMNLKGILVGNPYVSEELEMAGVVPFIYYHALCSRATYEDVVGKCFRASADGARSHLIRQARGHIDVQRRVPTSDDPACRTALQTMMGEVGNHINQYDIYWNCSTSGVGLDCSNFGPLTKYLNRADVQHALHARPTSWAVCANLNYVHSWPTVANIYPELNSRLRVTLYSGDVTFNVPFTSTEMMIDSLKMGVTDSYKAWMLDGQVGGYVIKYSGMNYVTVKGSGHMVPLYTPAKGAALFNGYLDHQF